MKYVCVCMSVYIYVCMYMYIYVCMCVDIDVCIKMKGLKNGTHLRNLERKTSI